MKRTRLFHLAAGLASVLLGLAASATTASGPWDKPAASLVEQIAAILGPGEAHLTIRNLSTIPTDEIPVIRRLLVEDLKSHGVAASGAESANTVRVTLSENARERLWVAEVVEGNETRVAMVEVDAAAPATGQSKTSLVLRKQIVMVSKTAVLSALEANGWLAIVEPEELVLYFKSGDAWKESRRLDLAQKVAPGRDPRGLIAPAIVSNESGFEAFVAGTKCSGHFGIDDFTQQWTAWCLASDDPWLIAQSGESDGSVSFKAFYNAARNYFTGVISPSIGVDLPPFYSAALIPRPAGGVALLINGIDGKAQIAENGTLKTISGARDWGSDFATIHSGCGTQVVVSGSGEAATDSLRAYELPAQEAVPASAALPMDGTVTALWTAPDGKSVLAVVRNAADQYEVDRVTALCN